MVELDDLAAVHALHEAVLRSGIAAESVPGWRTLLVTTDGPLGDLMAAVRRLATSPPPVTAARTQTISVLYDGEDLPAVADRCGLSQDAVVRLHTSTAFTVAFLGFSRGFPYLAGLPAPLHLPRRSTPRPRVPAGSVAVALDQCGIYPAASPGGWHLIGTTAQQLFDPAQDPPSALRPGDQVRFVQVER